MVVSVLAILKTDFVPQKSQAKIMNERLERAAKKLQQVYLKRLSGSGFSTDDPIVYLSYNPKFKIRFRVVNDVPSGIEYSVNELCARLGYMPWKMALLERINLQA